MYVRSVLLSTMHKIVVDDCVGFFLKANTIGNNISVKIQICKYSLDMDVND